MNDKKNNAYKAVLLSCTLGTFITGINYLLYKEFLMGIAFILTLCASLLNIFAYITESRNSSKG